MKVLSSVVLLLLAGSLVNGITLSPILQCMNKLRVILTQNPATADDTTFKASSSQGFNTLGDMDRCLNMTDSYFVSLNLNKNINNIVGAPYVLCVPTQCSSQVINKNITEFSNFLSEIVKKFPNADPVEITNAYDPVNDGPSFGAGASLVFVLVLLYAIAGVVCSVLAYLKSEQKRQVRVQRRESEREAARSSMNSSIIERVRDSKMTRLIKGFSLYDNFVNLFSFQALGHIDLAFLNATRFVLMCWIIWGNSAFIRFQTVKNVTMKSQLETTAGFSTILNGSTLAIDLFFAISGFLLVVKALDRFQKRTQVGVLDLLVMIAHRILRLWPVYVIMVLIYWQLIPFTGQAPMWDRFTDITSACSSNIWANILMIDNIAINGSTQGCFEWGWVVASEVQFCIIGLFVLFIYRKNSAIGLGIIAALFITSSVLSILIANSNNFLAVYFTMYNPDNFYNGFFIKPYIRIATYLLGMLAGIMYKSYKSDTNKTLILFAKIIRKNLVYRWSLYFFGVAIMSLMVWIVAIVQYDPTNWGQGMHSTYLAFGKVGFAFGFFFLVLPILLGHSNFFKVFFGKYFWIPLSRITFCMYLCQQWVIQRSQYNIKSIRYYDNQTTLILAISDTCMTFLASTLLMLLIEIPIQNMVKIFILSPSQINGLKASMLSDDSEARELKKKILD